MANFITNKGVNNPSFFKGFPMNAILYLGIAFFGVGCASLILFGIFFNLLITGLLSALITGIISRQVFVFFKKTGARGLSKVVIRYFKKVERFKMKHQKIMAIRIYPSSQNTTNKK
jgi:hypothetical protein